VALPYRILERKRAGRSLAAAEIEAVVKGASDGSWADAQLAAFLMAVAIRGLDPEETRTLTRAMRDSGERWRLSAALPGVGDKHSTGGVGDKVSLVLAPLLAACDRPVAMLTGRGLGHTAGTADKLEAIAGIDLALDRRRMIELVAATGMAMGVATAAIAPADRRLYALRDATATIDSLPLITASILSKKLATGAAAVVYDVKVGAGAFLPELGEARELARLLVATSSALGTPARALLTDMSQPLGRWVGHAAEVRESLACLAGDGPGDLVEVTLELASELTALTGERLASEHLAAVLASGRAREAFDRWASAQGARPGWEQGPRMTLAADEVVLTADRAGWLSAIETRELGLLLAEAGGGRARPGDAIDPGISLEVRARLGDRVEPGQELARLYLRRRDEALSARTLCCFALSEASVAAPPLVRERL
jgi:pyrimidine-nucleoside phosphorylase